MKRIGVILVFLFSFLWNSYSQEDVVEETIIEETVDAPEIHIKWEATLQSAIEKATNEQKPILIYFTGSDWCGPCIQLDENLFHTEKFEKFSNENLVLYVADFPRDKSLVSVENRKINNELRKKYKQSSFPTILFINEKGDVLGRKNGKYMTEYYYSFLKKIVSENR